MWLERFAGGWQTRRSFVAVGIVLAVIGSGFAGAHAGATTPKSGCTATGPSHAPGSAHCWFIADNVFDVVAVGRGHWWAEVRHGRHVIELGDVPHGYDSQVCFLQGTGGQHEAYCDGAADTGDRVMLWAGPGESVSAVPDAGCRHVPVPTPCHPYAQSSQQPGAYMVRLR